MILSFTRLMQNSLYSLKKMKKKIFPAFYLIASLRNRAVGSFKPVLYRTMAYGCLYNLYSFRFRSTEIKCSIQCGMCSDKKRLCSLEHGGNVTFPPPGLNLSTAP